MGGGPVGMFGGLVVIGNIFQELRPVDTKLVRQFIQGGSADDGSGSLLLGHDLPPVLHKGFQVHAGRLLGLLHGIGNGALGDLIVHDLPDEPLGVIHQRANLAHAQAARCQITL